MEGGCRRTALLQPQSLASRPPPSRALTGDCILRHPGNADAAKFRPSGVDGAKCAALYCCLEWIAVRGRRRSGARFQPVKRIGSYMDRRACCSSGCLHLVRLGFAEHVSRAGGEAPVRPRAGKRGNTPQRAQQQALPLPRRSSLGPVRGFDSRRRWIASHAAYKCTPRRPKRGREDEQGVNYLLELWIAPVRLRPGGSLQPLSFREMRSFRARHPGPTVLPPAADGAMRQGRLRRAQRRARGRRADLRV